MLAHNKKEADDFLYMEDMNIGQKFTSPAITVSAEDIVAFAEQFDPQPFHLDPVAAEDTLFKGHAASGWHTAAVTMRLMLLAAPNIKGGMIGRGIDKLNWPRPVRPGDSLSVEIELLEMRVSNSNPKRGIARTKIVTRNQKGEPVQDMECVMFVPRRDQ
jgi:acyl dehydratase